MFICRELSAGNCVSWASLDEVASDFASLGITPDQIATSAGGVAAGLVGIWVLGMMVGTIVRLIRQALEGE